MKKVAVVLFLFIYTTCGAQVTWKSDIDFLKTELAQKHVNLFFQFDRESFEQELDVLAQKADGMQNIDVVLSLQKTIAKVGDSHTMVGYFSLLDKTKVIPTSLYWFDDGIYLIATTNEHKQVLGKRLVGVGTHPISEVVDSLKTLVVQDNDAMNKQMIPRMLSYTQILSFFKFIPNDSAAVEFRFSDSTSRVTREVFSLGALSGQTLVQIQPKAKPLYTQNRKALFWDRYLDDSTYYIQYNSCMGREVATMYGRPDSAQYPSFKNFTDSIFITISEKPIARFVFDMRANGGGSSAQGTEFVSRLKENEKVNKEGVLYVIIGRSTFSSAILNTLDFKSMTKAITVGEETAGMPNHYGEVRSFELPDSKIAVQYSTNYFKHTDDDLKTITPNVRVTYNFSHYANGIDPSMQAIKEGQKNKD